MKIMTKAYSYATPILEERSHSSSEEHSKWRPIFNVICDIPERR